MGKRGKQRDWQRINELVTAYERLGSLRLAAAEFGVTHQAIAHARKVAGKSRLPGTPKNPIYVLHWDAIVQRCHDTRSIPKVAAEFGVSKWGLYEKLKQAGVRIKPLNDPEALFWSRIQKGADDECWHWTGAVHKTGYGSVNLRRKAWYAHRLAWHLANGVTPNPKLEVAHLCGLKTCCNPKHLRPVTREENLSHIRVHKRVGRGPQAVEYFS